MWPGESPVVMGVLPHSQRLTERFRSVGTASGWVFLRFDLDSFSPSLAASCDAAVLILDRVTGENLTWISSNARQIQIPLVVIARDQDARTVARVLGSGADEYVAHPFVVEEIVARLNSLVSRARGQVGSLPLTRLQLDPHKRTLGDGVRHVHFSKREWSVLTSLLRHDGQVLSTEELARLGDFTPGSQGAVVSVISRLRKRLERSSFNALSIETVHGRGYALRLRGGVRVAA